MRSEQEENIALSCGESGEEVRIVGYDSETDFVLNPYPQDF